MNQKYLQGLSSDMDSPEDAVFFKATPHNIAAFLAAHRRADMSAIGTVDEKTFLTARMGLIKKEDRLSYYENLEAYAVNGDLQPFAEMIAGLEEQRLDEWITLAQEQSQAPQMTM